MDKTTLIKNFIRDAGSSIISVKFIKANGEQRSLQFNPRDTQEIKGTGYKLTNPAVISCRDFTIALTHGGGGAWRSFDCNRVISIKAKGKILELQP